MRLYFVLVLVLGPPVLVLHVPVLAFAPLVLVLDDIVLATRLLCNNWFSRVKYVLQCLESTGLC